MLTGAARAARTAGVLRLERVWVVAVPVVVLVVLERLVTVYILQWTLGAFGWSHPWAELVGRAGPMPLRTALVAMSLAVLGYAFLWSMIAIADYVRAVKREGRRVFLRGGVFGRLVIFGSLLVMLSYETTVVTSLPTAEEVMVAAEADFDTGVFAWGGPFAGALSHDVPGIRAFCRKRLEQGPRDRQLRAAMALTRLGAGTDRSIALLRSITRVEYLDPKNGDLMADLVRYSCAAPPGQLLPRRTGGTPEEQEERWQEFRRDHIP